MCSRKMKEYKAIFIDWDDTIGDFQYAENKALWDVYHHAGLDNVFDRFELYYNQYHENNLYLWELYGQGKISKKSLQFSRFLYPIKNLLGVDREWELAETMGDEFLELTNEYFRLLPNAEEVIRYLANKYPLTIVSNGFVEVQYNKIELSGLKDCFKHVLLSEEVGIAKPSVGIFEKALELNGVDKTEVLMIGDSYKSDIQGAINAGIDQLWITPDIDDSREATYKVANILDVMNIV